MYKTINRLFSYSKVIACIGFGIPIMGLLKGRGGNDSLFTHDKNLYFKVSLFGIAIAILFTFICIVLKRKISNMDCEIKSLQSYTAPVDKYELVKSKYLVIFRIDGKSYKHKFETIGVKKINDFKKGSLVRYKIYKGEVIPEIFYLASPKREKGIKNKLDYLHES